MDALLSDRWVDSPSYLPPPPAPAFPRKISFAFAGEKLTGEKLTAFILSSAGLSIVKHLKYVENLKRFAGGGMSMRLAQGRISMTVLYGG